METIDYVQVVEGASTQEICENLAGMIEHRTLCLTEGYPTYARGSKYFLSPMIHDLCSKSEQIAKFSGFWDTKASRYIPKHQVSGKVHSTPGVVFNSSEREGQKSLQPYRYRSAISAYCMKKDSTADIPIYDEHEYKTLYVTSDEF